MDLVAAISDLTMRPIKRTAMKMHHRFDVQLVGVYAVNYSIGKASEVELAIVAQNFTPAFRLI
jgi:hypothetical protein